MSSLDRSPARPRWMPRRPAALVGRLLAVLALVCLPAASVQAESASSTPTPYPSSPQSGTPTPTPTPPSTSSSGNEHWMADLNAYIGDRQLRNIVFPGSHDTATYALTGPSWTYGGAQNVDLKTQLTHGTRWLDIRANYHDGNYFVSHGKVNSDKPVADVLKDLTDWTNTPGHEREIVLAAISVGQDSADTGSPSKFARLCQTFKQHAGPALLTADRLGSWLVGATYTYYSANVYALTPTMLASAPGQPRLITDWSNCDEAVSTSQQTDKIGITSFPGYYAKQCWDSVDPFFALDPNPGVIPLIQQALQGRYQAGPEGSDAGYTGNPMGSSVSGFYTLSAAKTTTANCGVPLYWMGNDSAIFDAIKGWYLANANNARANLNILTTDFVQTNPVVEDAILFNQMPPLAAASAYTPIKVNLKTADGHVLTAVNAGGVSVSNIVHTDATSPGAWETFWAQWLDDAHTKLALRTASGNYMTAVNGGGMGKPWGWVEDFPLHTDASSAGAWEAFTLNVNPNVGSGNLQPATLQTPDGHYVSAVNGGGYGESGKNTVPIHMDVGAIGPDEQFSVVKR